MIRLVSHLEHLLRIHDCVIIPRLGGFVLQVVPASYAEEDHMFRPMHKDVVFNAKLKHNDGLLAERYMQAFGVTFQRACKMLEEDVTAISDELAKGLTVQLGAVGSFIRGAEGQLIFKTGDSGSFSIDSYGLAPFQLKTLELLRQDNPTDSTDNGKNRSSNKQVNRRVLRTVISSAAAVAAFFLLSTPVKEISRAAYTANFLPLRSETSAGSVAESPDMYVNDAELTPEAFGAIGTTDGDASVAEDIPQTIEPSIAEATTTTQPATESNITETFYVIIASVNSRTKANEYLAAVDAATMPNANTLASGSQIRIYADSFADKSLADAFLAKLRNNPRFADAWIYTQKK